ncbi:hypothetical protein ACOMCW_003283 [Yersinia enterocolitica]|uniref:hypothetical protein n=1 Tax=Yersinia enterocolitica TaxID=630 RepID=UPI0029ABF98D|nr:hypothetical protein [Yersinia enterocolitica]
MNKIRVVGIDIAKSVFQVCVWRVPLPGTEKYRVRNCWIRFASLAGILIAVEA